MQPAAVRCRGILRQYSLRQTTRGRPACKHIDVLCTDTTAQSPLLAKTTSTATKQQSSSGSQRKLQDPQPKAQLNCDHFLHCSGCTLHEGLDVPPTFTQARQFFAAKGVANFALRTCALHGWRCRARLAVRGAPGRFAHRFASTQHNVSALLSMQYFSNTTRIDREAWSQQHVIPSKPYTCPTIALLLACSPWLSCKHHMDIGTSISC